MSNPLQQEISSVKALRRDLDAIVQRIKAMPGTAERTLSLRRVQEGVMWLGMDLKRIGEANPETLAPAYPHSKDPASPVIDPPLDVTL